MSKSKTEVTNNIHITAPEIGRVTFNLLGDTALIFNAVSLKTQQTLLCPPPKKNATERAGSLKHDPMEEFFNSTYRHRDDTHPTRLFFPGGGFKGAMKSAALRLPGAKKTEIAQLTWVNGRDIDIYGVPQIYMTGVRSADAARTPDIRTRAILKQWAAQVTISYAKPQLSDKSVAALILGAGMLCGIGDGRQEKGYGHGTFDIVAEDDPRFLAIIKSGGRDAQDAALAKPECFDIETENLLAYFNAYVAARGDSAPKRKLRAVA